MKYFAPIGVLAISLVLAACSSSSSSSAQPSNDSTEPIAATAKPPRVQIPPGPPPGHLVVHDIRKGSGRAIPPHTSIGISTQYVGVSYGSGKQFEVRWDKNDPFTIEFGPGLENKGWEKGLVGMRVGGRRELIVPSKLAYETGALIYVIDLLAVK